MRKLQLLLPSIGALLAPPASALVVDFESLAHSGSATTIDSPPVYVEKGFTFTADTGFATWGSASSHHAGSAALYNDYPGEFTTLTRADSLPFELTSVDLAELFDDSTGISVEFNGTKSDSSTVSQTFVLDEFHDGTTASFETFAFAPGFTDLVSLSWQQEPGLDGHHQFDNFSLFAIPEPGTAGLLALGLIALARSARRR